MTQPVVVPLKGVAFTAISTSLATLVILTVLKAVFGSLRVDEDPEEASLDFSEHSEAAYASVGEALAEERTASGLSDRRRARIWVPRERRNDVGRGRRQVPTDARVP